QSADRYDISVPEDDEEGIPEETLFTYHEEGDKLIITNRITVPLGYAGYIDVAYLTEKKTFYYPDYGMAQSQTVNAKGASKPFIATISATLEEESDSATTEGIPVYINTTATLEETEKRNPKRYTTWQDSWGERPADANNYYYIVWEVRSFIPTPTQMYNFTLTDTFNETDAEVVGYRLANSGSAEFTSNNTEYNCTTGYEYGRYDYVLTRYLRSTYDAIIENADPLTTAGYSLTNKVKATVDPVDQVDRDTSKNSTKVFSYEQPTYEHPTGSFYMWKFGTDYRGLIMRDSEDARSFALGNLHEPLGEGGTETIEDLMFYTYVHGHPYPWTLSDANNDGVIDGRDADNPYAYGVTPVEWELTDNKFSVGTIAEESSSDLTEMTVEDYEIQKIKFDCQFDYAVYDEETATYQPADYDGDPSSIVVNLFVEVSDSGEYIPLGRWYPMLDSFEVDNSTYFSSYNNQTVFLKANVTGFKMTTSNAFYYTRMGAWPSIRLKRSALVTSFVEQAYADESRRIVVRNDASSKVYDHLKKTGGNYQYIDEPQEIIGFDRYGLDYVYGIVRDGHLTKDLLSYKNDKILQQLSIDYRVTAYEDFINVNGRREYVHQDSGIFYDLLPEGAAYEYDSVEAYADGEKLNEGEYEVIYHDNYNDTGRAMLIVKFYVPADKYMFYYTCVFSWDDVLTLIKDKPVINTVAYETGNSNIGDGRPDDGGDPDKITFKTLMNDLDPDTNADKFLYTESKQNITVVTTGSLGLYKKVKGEKNSGYVYKTTVYNGSEYSYKIRFATDFQTKATNLIIYDFLEQYETKKHDVSEWHGTLVYIDVSEMVGMGINPTIYYSTQEGTDIDAVSDVHSSFWVKADEYTGTLEEVRAFAIDLGNYVLEEGSAVSCIVYMQAPEGIDSESSDPNALNNIYLNKTYVDDNGNTYDPGIINQDFTDVKFRVVGKLHVLKRDSSDHTTAIQGVTFRLVGESFYGTDVNREVTTNPNGMIFFNDLERGNYQLQEIESIDDYQINTTIWQVVIDQNGKTYVNGELVDNVTYIIEDDPRIHGDLQFYKYGIADYTGAHMLIDGAVFKLTGESAYGNNISLTATSRDGVVVFRNIEYGSNYTITEISVPEPWQVSGATWKASVDQFGNVTMTGAENDNGIYKVYDEPFHNLVFKKLDAENTSRTLAGAVFRLTGTSYKGTHVDMTSEASDDFGTVRFEHLEAGVYTLQEIVPPTNYELDDTAYVITINEDGTVDGLTEYSEYIDEQYHSDYLGYYSFLDPRKYEGYITITKVWIDSDPETRPFPVVHISTEDPINKVPTATIDKTLWETYLNKPTGTSTWLKTAKYFLHNTDKTLEE
ncbi:MAG: hypothetical protein J5694_01850, partial [Erysipelotrichaceae bacterium]|nr:hypothetical protein [Erysipelotrichaceae bacterium]